MTSRAIHERSLPVGGRWAVRLAAARRQAFKPGVVVPLPLDRLKRHVFIRHER